MGTEAKIKRLRRFARDTSTSADDRRDTPRPPDGRSRRLVRDYYARVDRAPCGAMSALKERRRTSPPLPILSDSGPPATNAVPLPPGDAPRTTVLTPDSVDKALTHVAHGDVRGTIVRHGEKRWEARDAGGARLGEGKTRAAAVALIATRA